MDVRMANEPVSQQGTHEVSPFQAMLWSVGAFSSGAVFAGAVSFARTAKKLEEDGIEARLKFKGVPVALKAFAASTCLVCGMGLVGFMGLKYSLNISDTAQVSSWQAGIEELKRQQDFFRREFQAKVEKLKNRET
ncbi:hypothetical protein BSKO_06234 [Bryopsis sp. KO-2023]|nr:hypothetical protein BSKO_06234 [Bryopsis sp. KO-2023]